MEKENKNKKITISVSLSKITEICFEYNNEYDYTAITPETLLIEMQRKLIPNFDKEALDVNVIALYHCKTDNSILMKCGVSVTFKISEINNFIQINKDQSVSITNNEILLNLMNITLGTLRGVVYVKTKDTPLNEYPLPIMTRKSIENFLKSTEPLPKK